MCLFHPRDCTFSEERKDAALSGDHSVGYIAPQTANADSDGDGFSNKDEYVLGSDPKDKFSLPTINYDSEKQELGWTPVNGWDYVIQAKTNLNASKWTDISTNKYPKSTYQITPELKQAFFKIEARKSP